MYYESGLGAMTKTWYYWGGCCCFYTVDCGFIISSSGVLVI